LPSVYTSPSTAGGGSVQRLQNAPSPLAYIRNKDGDDATGIDQAKEESGGSDSGDHA
jgi:hypothetical protein